MEQDRKSTERPFLNLSVDAESKVLAEVALDNKNYRDASIRSVSYEPSKTC